MILDGRILRVADESRIFAAAARLAPSIKRPRRAPALLSFGGNTNAVPIERRDDSEGVNQPVDIATLCQFNSASSSFFFRMSATKDVASWSARSRIGLTIGRPFAIFDKVL